MPKLIIIRGIPGSGKTTYAKELQKLLKTDPVHLEADMFFMKNKEYCFDYKFLGDAHKWCQSTAAMALFNGIDVIVSNTFIKNKEIKPYYELALRYGAQFEIFNMSGDYGSVHGVPEEVIERMKSNFKAITAEEYMVHYEITNDPDFNFTKQRVPDRKV
jgi:tRNA uridine 5-carbamoylmethylation protein Kti12